MTGAEFAEHLVARGLTAGERANKARLFEAASGALGSGGQGGVSVCWVPGRLELFGKHTDYAGGRSILAAVPRGFVFASAPREDDEVHVVDAATGQRYRSGSEATSPGWSQYAQAVVHRLRRNFPGVSGGVTISFASDLPPAAGMSSSSALVVGFAKSLIRRWRIGERSDWRETITGPAALATYLSCIENGSDYRRLQGDAGVGTRGGSEDHVAMLLCRAGEFSAYSFMPLCHRCDVPFPQEWTVVIASSGVQADKAVSVKEFYNQLADATQLLLRLWNLHESPASSLSAALASDADAPERLKRLVRTIQIDDWPSERLTRRLEHLIVENRCVDDAVDAIETINGEALNRISVQSQQAAEVLLRQQVPETVALAHEAFQAGALGTSSFGAGFGGSVWAIVDSHSAQSFMSEWEARYRRRCPAREPSIFVAPPGPAVVELA